MAGLFWVIAVLGGLWLLLACSSPKKQDGKNGINRPRLEADDSVIEENQTQSDCWRRKIMEIIERNKELITAAGTIALAIATGLLWWATTNLVRDAKEASQRQLRAYVYLDITGRKYPPPPNTPNRFAISFEIKNSGTTWARSVRIKFDRVIDPSTADPFDAVKWNEIEAPPTIIGPGQRFDLQLPELQFSEQREVAENKKAIYYVVWVTYEDALADPPVTRRTQLSSRLNADREGAISFSWMPTHNCADDDCQ
jgi:hypothetical protein